MNPIGVGTLQFTLRELEPVCDAIVVNDKPWLAYRQIRRPVNLYQLVNVAQVSITSAITLAV